MTYELKSLNNTYEVVNWLRPDNKYNVYVQRTSNLTDAYKGENTFSIGVKEPMLSLSIDDVVSLYYND